VSSVSRRFCRYAHDHGVTHSRMSVDSGDLVCPERRRAAGPGRARRSMRPQSAIMCFASIARTCSATWDSVTLGGRWFDLGFSGSGGMSQGFGMFQRRPMYKNAAPTTSAAPNTTTLTIPHASWKSGRGLGFEEGV
jgi:hypothetical protein